MTNDTTEIEPAVPFPRDFHLATPVDWVPLSRSAHGPQVRREPAQHSEPRIPSAGH
jgi:hypothetical protein